MCLHGCNAHWVLTKSEDDFMEMNIRKAVDSDYDDLCKLFDEGDALHFENLPCVFQESKDPARDEEYILGLVSDEDVGLFIARVGSQAVGLVCVIVRESPAVSIFVPRRYAEVDNLVVKQAFRHAGIGRALMGKAHEWVQAKGLDSVELNVYEFNRTAIEFYHNLGYATTSRRMSRQLS